MNRIECSVWNNGSSGWGLRVLGGPEVRDSHFVREYSPVAIDLDGQTFFFNIDKDSFWRKCPELIGKPILAWARAHGLSKGDHVWLRVVEPQRSFKAVCWSPTQAR